MNHNVHIFLIENKYFRVRHPKVLSGGILVFIILSKDNNICFLSLCLSEKICSHKIHICKEIDRAIRTILGTLLATVTTSSITRHFTDAFSQLSLKKSAECLEETQLQTPQGNSHYIPKMSFIVLIHPLFLCQNGG